LHCMADLWVQVTHLMTLSVVVLAHETADTTRVSPTANGMMESLILWYELSQEATAGGVELVLVEIRLTNCREAYRDKSCSNYTARKQV
jgi:hypothetical protein